MYMYDTALAPWTSLLGLHGTAMLAWPGQTTLYKYIYIYGSLPLFVGINVECWICKLEAYTCMNMLCGPPGCILIVHEATLQHHHHRCHHPWMEARKAKHTPNYLDIQVQTCTQKNYFGFPIKLGAFDPAVWNELYYIRHTETQLVNHICKQLVQRFAGQLAIIMIHLQLGKEFSEVLIALIHFGLQICEFIMQPKLQTKGMTI